MRGASSANEPKRVSTSVTVTTGDLSSVGRMLRVVAPALLGVALAGATAGCGGAEPEGDSSEVTRFDRAWTQLIEYLEIHHPDVDLGLRPPASDEAIRQVEATIGRQLPEPVRELYRRADGQDGAAFALFPGYRFLPLEEVPANWQLLKHPMIWLLGLLPLGDNDPGVRNRGSHPGWIPLAENGAGDLICVDLVPAAGGTRGQLVELIHDDTPRRRLAAGITEMLEQMRQDLASGSLVVHHEWQGFVSKEDVPPPPTEP